MCEGPSLRGVLAVVREGEVERGALFDGVRYRYWYIRRAWMKTEFFHLFSAFTFFIFDTLKILDEAILTYSKVSSLLGVVECIRNCTIRRV